MRQKAAGQRSRRQTAPSGRALEQKVKEATELEMIPDGVDSVTDIRNELEFAQWYNEVEESLLEASYDEYQYAPPRSTLTEPLVYADINCS